MNSLPNKTTEPVVQADQIAVSLILTETTSLTEPEENPTAKTPKLETEMNRRATAMTTTLTRILDRPAAFRHWGLNE